MSDEKKPSTVAMKAAAKITHCVIVFQDLSDENAMLPPYDDLAEILDAELSPAVKAFKDLVRTVDGTLEGYGILAEPLAAARAALADLESK